MDNFVGTCDAVLIYYTHLWTSNHIVFIVDHVRNKWTFKKLNLQGVMLSTLVCGGAVVNRFLACHS